jgi:hypothetical protein
VWRSTDCGKTFQYMPEMELDSGTFGDGTDKTIVAFSQGGQPWTPIATPEINAWRTQIVPLDPVTLAIGGGVTDAFFRATKAAGKWSFSNVTPVNGGSANYFGLDWKKPPYSAITANIHAHTVIARTPGTSKALVVVPATIANQGHGFRIYFETTSVDEVSVTVRIDTPIEVDYYEQGGILPFVLHQLMG